jgi:glycosidase
MHHHLSTLYPPSQIESLAQRLEKLAADFARENPELSRQSRGLVADQSEVLLIAYGDQVTRGAITPLNSLLSFMQERLPGVTGLHLLPHFPYSSDDGFSVIDYRQVDPQLGSWDDVKALAKEYSLMFDAVINHISAESTWSKEFLSGNDNGFLLTSDPQKDHSDVIRPRTHPLLTPVDTPDGQKHLWTTFSADQIDLDFSNPDLLCEIADVLLLYARYGARYLRLDAVGFLWKELGTTCMHLPQTHELVKLTRTLFDAAAPGVCLVPEINGTYEENAPYFGNGRDEAQMVYNFPLPPLVVHSFHTGDATVLNDWLTSLESPPPGTTFFNFLSSHDGIGVRPVDNLLTTEQVQSMTKKVRAHGGQVSNRLVDGHETPYELNITFYDALTAPDEAVGKGIARMRSSHALLLALAGIPGIYFNSIVGGSNWQDGFAETGRNRTLNRRKYRRQELDDLLEQDAQMGGVIEALLHLVQTRAEYPQFHPQAPQQIERLHSGVVAIRRGDILAISSVSDEPISLPVGGRDVLSGRVLESGFELEPYGVVWLGNEIEVL